MFKLMKKKISVLSLFFLILLFIFPSYSKALEKQFNFNPEVMVKSQKEAKYAPGELILKFKKGQKPQGINPASSGMASIDDASKKNGAYKIEPIFKNHSNDELGQFYKVKLPKTSDIKKVQVEFDKLDVVEKAAPNYLAKAAWTPNDTYYPNQWALPQINASSAWDTTQGSSDTVIAVIDSGVDTDHPDLASKIWVNTADPVNGFDDDGNGLIDDNIGWDYVANDGYAEYVSPPYPPGCIARDPADPNRTADNDPNPEPTGLDEDECLFPGVDNGRNHGTSVAGIAAAVTNNAAGVAGVCPNCSIMALRVLDDEGWGDYAQIAAAIVYAGDKGADIINMSLAGPYDDTIIDVALHSAFDDGSILVSAAGNGDIYGVGYDIDPVANKLSPVCNDDYDYVDGGENEIIGVAAVNPSDVKMSWSNYGKKYVDISAPGTNLYAPIYDGGGYTSGFGGTSGATPIVSGTLGLVKSNNPTWDNKAVRDATIDLITNINSVNPSYSGKLGGRLKADRALDPNERLNPSGTLIKGSGPNIYLIQNGHKRFIPSVEIYFSHFQGWYFANISDSRLNDYPNGPDLLFREGTLVKASDSANVYQIEYPSSTKRFITSPDVFLGLGYQWEDIIATTSAIISQHPTGSNINAITSHVSGALVKNNSSPEVYLLSPGSPKVKHLIINPQIYSQYFRWQDIAVISQTELDSYTNGTDYHFQDGAVLKGTADTVYLVAYGKKRAFASPDAYVGRGYNWGQFVTVTDSELTNYATGEDLN